MKYVLLMMGNLTDPECGEGDGPDPADFMAYDQALHAAGVHAGGDAMHGPENGTSVTAGTNGEPVVTHGPYAETREFVGGWWIIDVPDLDTAVDWARKAPGLEFGRIEVRPLAEY